ncbi:Hypothetical predicted protein [Mytilus galloprovincialis]|uniref:C1q domain-containing protein n=1 Tax=Mytilus galloprovincialis TaxID=29158 RepID=A0A8B6GWY5_MYTGA|nr:Hypothetical predicted protein [Mytilus galloprovincialis]
MTPILAGILLVLMCRASTAHFTVTLPIATVPRDFADNSIVKYSVNVDNDQGEYAGGTFTVPTNGVYSLSVSMMSGLYLTAHCVIYRNNDRLVWLYTGSSYDMASQTINVRLTANDLITVRMESGTSLFSAYNTFSAIRILD